MVLRNLSIRSTGSIPSLRDIEEDDAVAEFDEMLRSTQLASINMSSQEEHVANINSGSNPSFHSFMVQMASTQSNNASHQEEQVAGISADIGISKKKGRGRTCNAALAKKKAKGKKLDIQFPAPYFKVCGKHAKLFKSEVSVCVNQIAPLQVKCWKHMKAEDIRTMWRFLKDSLSLSQDDYPHVMRQVQTQYRTRTYSLHKAYLAKEGRPNDVSTEDWEWLIENKWTTKNFKDTSKKNTTNRGKQENRSVTGTKSIVQTAYEMRDPETKAWPNAVDVWKKIGLKSNGTWKVGRGEEILNKLKEVGDTHQEQISSAPVPMVEHFALVLGRKSGYSRGVGSTAVSSTSLDRQRIYKQAEIAHQRADEMEKEVQRLMEVNTKIQTELENQRKSFDTELQNQRKDLEIELEDQRKALETQRAKMHAELREEMKSEMTTFFQRFIPPQSAT